MTDEPDDDEYFLELLEKKGDAWLKQKLEALGLKIEATKPSPSQSPSPGSPDFASFLLNENERHKKEKSAARIMLDRALDLLTPEQRALIREPQKSEPNPSPEPKKTNAPAPNPEPKKSGFLRRI